MAADRLFRELPEAARQALDDLPDVLRQMELQTLETLRLELLRFHEGGGTLDGLTAQLDAAREITLAVDRLLAGRREMQEVLDELGVVSTG